MELVADIAPRPDLAADYVALAALLHHPGLAAPYVSRLHPAAWTTQRHRIIARIAVSHLTQLGRVDHRQLTKVLLDAGTFAPEALALEMTTLARIADLIHADGIVPDAVATLTTRGREVTA